MPWQDVAGPVVFPRVSFSRPGDLISGPQGNDSIDKTGGLRLFANTELLSHPLPSVKLFISNLLGYSSDLCCTS